jgi:hypothetical protein
MATRMQQRRGTAAQWISTNSGNGPILNAGEIGFETDTNKFKIGDGTNHWINLDYFIDANSTVNPAFGSSITFEGATANAFETTLAVTDPTADRTLTLPDSTGTVATQEYVDSAAANATFDSSSAAGVGLDWNGSTDQFDIDSTVTTNTGTQTLTNKTLTSPVITGAVFNDGSIVFEGSTENAHETTFTVTDPTADRTITFPDATGTVALTANVAALSGATFTGAVAGTDLTLSGNLTVNGTTTSIVSSELVIADKNITLSATQSPTNLTANGGGITVKGSTDKTFSYTEASDQWSSSESINIPTGKSYRINGVSLGTVSETLSNKTISSSDNTISLTPSNITGVTVTATEINYLNGVTSAIQTQLNAKASTSELSTHASDTTAIHGISDTSLLVTTTGAQTLTNKTITTPSGLVKSDVGLGNVDNTSDASKPVSTAAQTALDLKAPLANPTFTGTVTLPANTISQSMMGDDSVGTNEIGGLAVTTAKIADGAVTSLKIANDTIVDADINSAAAIAQSKISGLTTDLAAKLALAGGTMTGALTLSGAPTSDLHAATKLYVDNVTAGINFHESVHAASTINISANYSNGTSGVGATLTADTNRAFSTLDGESVTIGQRVLIKNQTDAKQNGIYTLTTVGSVSVPWVLTRATDADNNPTGEMKIGDFVLVLNGTTQASIGYINNSATNPIVIGTDNISYTEFSAGKTVVAGNGLTEATPGTLSINTDVTATKASVDLKAPIAAPTFTGLVTVSASGVAFTDGTQIAEGVPSRTVIIQRTASNTLSGVERDDLIEMASASAMTLTIPADSTFNFPVGTSMDVLQTSTGQVTIAGAGGVTVNATPGLKLRTQWSSATLFKRAANTWVVFGDLTA